MTRHKRPTFDAMAHLRTMATIYEEDTLHRSRATSSSPQTLPTLRPTLIALLLVSVSFESLSVSDDIVEMDCLLENDDNDETMHRVSAVSSRALQEESG